MNNEQLIYLHLKYGTDECSISILNEIPAEIVFNAYRKHQEYDFPSHMELTDSIIVDRFTPLLKYVSSHGISDTKFEQRFSRILLEEIKKYYA